MDPEVSVNKSEEEKSDQVKIQNRLNADIIPAPPSEKADKSLDEENKEGIIVENLEEHNDRLTDEVTDRILA